MPKLIWVALPLLAALLLLAVLALRRRWPSRQALNMVGSVLLAAYVATTAGLGIFWVANQQLPVFDWHYLFGYTTVLLVVLHLWFNLPLVWRWLTRRQHAQTTAAAEPTRETPPPRRRTLLVALGVAVTSAAAFVLGLRHGRSELRVAWPQSAGAGSATPGATDPGMAFVERFHAFSSTSRAGVVLRAPSLDWGDAPPPFKSYSGAPLTLPAPRGATPARFDVGALGAALWHTAGITARRGPIALRASPSSGALFSTELYVAVRTVPGLAPGWWHYDALHHALHRLSDASSGGDALGSPGDDLLQDAAAVVLASAVFRRTGHKYRDRTYRYVLADLGHALENLRVAAGALGVQALLLPRFDEAPAAAVLRLDSTEEGVLALVALHPGAPRPAAQPASRPVDRDAQWHSPPPPDATRLPLGVTSAMHLASSLQAAASRVDPIAPRPAAVMPRAIALPAVAPATAPVLDLIAVRRSVRRFAATPMALPALSAVLRAMSGGGAARLSNAVRINLVVHHVAGLASGAYRYEMTSHTLAPRGPSHALRAGARSAALDQDVIGDAAAVFVLSVDRATIAADAAGAPRGYRHALLEAGMVGERIYLEGGARGLGVCAVGAFFDEEAAALVGVDPAQEWVVHFAAIGVPAA